MSEIIPQHAAVKVRDAYDAIRELSDAHSDSIFPPDPCYHEGFYRRPDAAWRVHFNDRGAYLMLSRLLRSAVTIDASQSVPVDEVALMPARGRMDIVRNMGAKFDISTAGAPAPEHTLFFHTTRSGRTYKGTASRRGTIADLAKKDVLSAQVISAAYDLTSADRSVTSLASAAELAAGRTGADALYAAAARVAQTWPAVNTLFFDSPGDTYTITAYAGRSQEKHLMSIDSTHALQTRLDGHVAAVVEPPVALSLEKFADPVRSYGIVMRHDGRMVNLLIHGSQPAAEALIAEHGTDTAYLFQPLDRRLQLDRLSGRCRVLTNQEIEPFIAALDV
jgi:hypothetical protein